MNDGVTAEQVNGVSPAPQLQNSTIPDEPRDSVRDDVIAAIEKLKSDPAEKQVAAADDTDHAPSSDRLRNERGQFIKADGTVDTEAEAARTVTDAGEPQDKPLEPSQANEAPKGLSADIRAKWQTLDPSIQAEFRRRDEAAENGARQWSEEKRTYEQSLAPLKDFSGKYGIDDRTALTRLLDWQAALERNPREAIMQLAQISGIDLSNANQQQSQSQAATYDPRFDAIVPVVSQFQDFITNNQIDQFRTSPGHEHFDAVRVKMGELIERDNRLSLQDAYDQAVWLEPEVRTKLIAAQVQPTQQKAKDQQQVQKSKQAAVGPRGSGPNGEAPKPKRDNSNTSLREDIIAAMAEVRGNA